MPAYAQQKHNSAISTEAVQLVKATDVVAIVAAGWSSSCWRRIDGIGFQSTTRLLTSSELTQLRAEHREVERALIRVDDVAILLIVSLGILQH